MTSIAAGLAGIWDDVVDAARDAIVYVQAQHRRVREDQVAQLTAGSGERFRIEPDQVPQVIADLEAALVRLRDIRRRAEYIAHTPPPGRDEISDNAVRQIGEMAMGDAGSLRAALDVYEEEIRKTINRLDMDLKNYLNTESYNVPPASAWPA